MYLSSPLSHVPCCNVIDSQTGTSGPMAARLGIARAQNQLSTEAGLHLHIKNFSIINQVGACNLNATLECNGFANAHPHDSHYDQQSFVGLAWRPAGECICCEVYSTGRAKYVCISNTQRSSAKVSHCVQFSIFTVYQVQRVNETSMQAGPGCSPRC
jgi:TATA-box binding protein (TBP) (component of TFIID and TFIIIB)